MKTSELRRFLKGFVFLTVDGSPALARLNRDRVSGVYFLEQLPFPQALDSSYERIWNLTAEDIQGLKPNGHHLLFSTISLSTKDAESAASSGSPRRPIPDDRVPAGQR